MNTKISNKGYGCIIFFTSQAMFLGVGIPQILNSSNQSSPFSILLGSILGILILYLFTKLFNYEKDLNLFQKLEKLFGKVIGNFINFLLTLLFSIYYIYTLWGLEVYIQNKYLDKTPSIVILLIFIIPIIYLVSKGFKTLSKVSFISFVICLLEIILCIFGLTNLIEIDNLKPFFETSFMTIIKDSLYFISYFFAPTFLMLTIPKNQINNQKYFDKNLLIYYVICTINLFLLVLFIVSIFGIELAKLYYYPEFALISKINYFDFIQHVENILSTQWLFSLFISACMALLFVQNYLKHKNINKKIIYYVLIIIFLIFATMLFDNTTIGYNFASKYFSIIYSIPLLILIVISLIIIKFKKSKN